MVNLPDATPLPSGQITGMDLKAILRRIEDRIEALGTTANAVGSESGKPWLIPNIKKAIKDGRDSVTLSTITSLAAPLKVTQNWLLTGEGPESPELDVRSEDVAASLSEPPKKRQVYIRGYIGAAGEGAYYRYADEMFEAVDAPADATDQTVALEIKGTSWGPRVVNWLVFYDDIRSPITPDLIGKTCVIGLADDRILLKEIRRNRRGGFDLYSNSEEPPIENAQIEWAALVTGMRQR